MNIPVDHILAQIPQWAGAPDLQIEPIGGLTNTNYLVTVGTERFVLRVNGQNSKLLEINRAAELEALKIAEQAGIGAKVEHFILPEGHLVTRFIVGQQWSVDEYRQPENLRRMVATVKRIHAFPVPSGAFSPFRRVDAYTAKAREFGVPFPADFDVFTAKMRQIESAQQRDASDWRRFCHNDLFSVNFLDDGNVRVLDWEFAGLGDIYFDLAALVYAYDSDGPLPADLEEFLLECYFGAVTDLHRERLAGMKFMLLFFTAMWGLMQHGAQMRGLIPLIEGFDYLDYALGTFYTLRASFFVKRKNMSDQGADNRLTFRDLQDERDYPLLLELNLSSRRADKNTDEVTLEAIAEALAHMDGLTPQRGVLIASSGETPIGYSRLGWYSSRPETRLYYQISFLREGFREGGFWPLLIAANERRLREVAAEQTPVPERYFQAWASDWQKDWMAVLDSCGYKVVRRFNNMLHPLTEIPQIPLPAGFEVRPVGPEDMRAVWEMQKEMNAGLFENVAEDWLDEKYPEWLANPENNPRFWQVAWADGQLAGMVLAHLDEQENEKQNRKRGFTEHIYVRPPWRGRGLASALIARSLQVLKAQGMTEAELGVDSENESAAFRLYQKMGYQTYGVDTWFRKAME
jgi:thiamine kinase-like enzyme/GNAT superfamily N-acetyltransferase